MKTGLNFSPERTLSNDEQWDSASQEVGTIEQLPKWLLVIPMILQWLWLAIRYRSLTLPSSANPYLTSGGLVGESKVEYLAGAGPVAWSSIAAFTSIHNMGPCQLADTQARIRGAGLTFPLVAKPDIGWCGYGVRLIRNSADLAAYLDAFPLKEQIIFQRYLPQVGEAGLFYVRWPGTERGRVTAMVLRYPPCVVGDGRSSIATLMAADRRLRRLVSDKRSQTSCDLSLIPTKGEVVRLATVGSTRVGGRYEDASEKITAALSDAIDRIARDMPAFHVGRFDLRFDSLDALAGGEGFALMEINGVGSEAVHAWDPTYKLSQVYRMVFAKQRLIFALGDAMRRRGHLPVRLRELIRLHRRQQQLIRRYPPSN